MLIFEIKNKKNYTNLSIILINKSNNSTNKYIENGLYFYVKTGTNIQDISN